MTRKSKRRDRQSAVNVHRRSKYGSRIKDPGESKEDYAQIKRGIFEEMRGK